MSRTSSLSVVLLAGVCLATSIGIQPALIAQVTDDEYEDVPEESLVNTNVLLKRHAADLKYSASTAWTSYPVKHLFDGDQSTSWFSARNDIASEDSQPWVEVEFPVGVNVIHVNVWGNRNPSWSTGYSVTRGRLELYDKAGELLESVEIEAEGDAYDFDFSLDDPVDEVRRVRFVSLADQGTMNGDRCIALGEMEIE